MCNRDLYANNVYYINKKKIVYSNNNHTRNVKTSLTNRKLFLKKVCALKLLVNDDTKNVYWHVFGHIIDQKFSLHFMQNN